MILWCDGPSDPAEQMRRDTALLARFEHASRAGEDVPPPVLRLFRFAPHGITLGHGQDPARVLDLERCRAAGVPWAVRPTGGRAIFHAEEWTYSLSAAIDDPAWGGSLAEAYDRVTRLVLDSLRSLGVPAETARGRASAEGDDAHPACFASATRHEVLVDGRKLVGSAQRRTARGLLQQGSVLLSDGHLRLADCLALPDWRRATAREALAAASTHAGDLLGPDAPIERWADTLTHGLGPGVRRVDGAAGRFLLTLPEMASYTSGLS